MHTLYRTNSSSDYLQTTNTTGQISCLVCFIGASELFVFGQQKRIFPHFYKTLYKYCIIIEDVFWQLLGESKGNSSYMNLRPVCHFVIFITFLFLFIPTALFAEDSTLTPKSEAKINMAVADFTGLNVSQADASIVAGFLRTELGKSRFV
jgi:hypothetical protein